MAKRNYVEEILSIRLRNELSPRWGGALIRLRALEHELKGVSDQSHELAKYFPIAAIATIESYFRSAIKELIDHGPPFSENAASFGKERDIPIDFATLLAVQGKAVTLGDLISHVLPLKSLDDIDRHISTILATSFLESIKATEDRWEVEVEGRPAHPIINDPARVYKAVKDHVPVASPILSRASCRRGGGRRPYNQLLC